MKHRTVSIIITLALVLGLFSALSLSAAGAESYLIWDGSQLVSENLPADMKPVNTDTTTLSNGWYVVSGEFKVSNRITVSGNDVHLILKDHCELTVEGGIRVDSGNNLTIYAQSEDENTMGRLVAGSLKPKPGSTNTLTAAANEFINSSNAGIGGNGGKSGGTITINGGRIEATGGNGRDGGAGIGGGGSYSSTDGGVITINGGIVIAKGQGISSGAAGIGGGLYGSGGTITINGGTVKADGHLGGAGIGGGDGRSSKACNIKITGGTVEATGSNGGAGIGGGRSGLNTTITINISDGTVTANGKGSDGFEIGSGKVGKNDAVRISGGTIITPTGGKPPRGSANTIATGCTVNSIPYYAVNFDVRGQSGASTPTMQGVAQGDTVVMPNVDVEGYSVSWCTDEACNTPYDFNTQVTGDLTLYAKWTKVTDMAIAVEVEGEKTTYYTSIKTAWGKLSGKTGTLRIQKDVTSLETLTVNSGMNVTVEMDEGASLKSTADGCCFVVESGGILNLVSGSVKHTNSSDGIALVRGELHINGGSYISSGYGVWNQYGTVQISNGTIGAGSQFALNNNKAVKNMLAEGCAVLRVNGDDKAGVTDEELQNEQLKSGTYTIMTCYHDGFQFTDNKNGTHTHKCPYCGANRVDNPEPENCVYTFAEGSTVGTCSDCGSQMSVKCEASGLVYDGSEQKPDVTFTIHGKSSTAGEGYTKDYQNNVNAGTGTVTVSGGQIEGSVSLEFSIEKAAPVVKWQTTSESVEYTGQQAVIKPPEVTLANGEKYEGEIKYFYKMKGSTDDKFQSGLPTNVYDDGYDVKAEIAASDNYNGTVLKGLTLNITPKPFKVTFDDQTVTYGETPSGASAEQDCEKIAYEFPGDDGKTYPYMPENAGVYTVTATATPKDKNYAVSSGTATITINKAPLTITGAAVGDKLYDATTFTDNVSDVQFDGLVKGQRLTSGDDYTAAGTFEDAGIGEGKPVTVSVALKDSVYGKNYEVVGTFKTTGNIVIGKPEIIWTKGFQTVTYTGKEAVIEPPEVELGKGEVFSGEIHYSYSTSDSGFFEGLPTDVGEYEVRAKVDAQGNYGGADSMYNRLRLRIVPAALGFSWVEDQSLPYTGKPAKITAPAVHVLEGDEDLVQIHYHYNSSDGGSEEGLPTEPGYYIVYAIAEAGKNYSSTGGFMHLQIYKEEEPDPVDPDPVDPTPGGPAVSWRDADNVLNGELSLSGLTEGEWYVVVLKKTSAPSVNFVVQADAKTMALPCGAIESCEVSGTTSPPWPNAGTLKAERAEGETLLVHGTDENKWYLAEFKNVDADFLPTSIFVMLPGCADAPLAFLWEEGVTVNLYEMDGVKNRDFEKGKQFVQERTA